MSLSNQISRKLASGRRPLIIIYQHLGSILPLINSSSCLSLSQCVYIYQYMYLMNGICGFVLVLRVLNNPPSYESRIIYKLATTFVRYAARLISSPHRFFA